MSEFVSNTISETNKIAKKIAATLRGGDIVLLHGELGAGKTTFTKGLMKYFGVKKNITSPTFTLMNFYEGKNKKEKLNLIHIDTYRLENEDKLKEIGAEDYLGTSDTICIIEWPEKIKNLLQGKKTIKIKIEHTGKKQRKIIIKKES